MGSRDEMMSLIGLFSAHFWFTPAFDYFAILMEELIVVLLLLSIHVSATSQVSESVPMHQSRNNLPSQDAERDERLDNRARPSDVITPQCEEGVSMATVNYQLVPYTPVKVLPLLQEAERIFEFAGKDWVIGQEWDQVGLAAVVWEAAIALCQYLESNRTLVTGKRVIELGAGTGLVGMVASAIGAQSVVLTDKQILSTDANLKRNRHNVVDEGVVVSKLEWGEDIARFNPPFDVILAADVIYVEESFPLLVKSLSDLSSPTTTVLLSHKQRYSAKESRFFSLLHGEKFKLDVVWSNSEHNLTVYNISKYT